MALKEKQAESSERLTVDQIQKQILDRICFAHYRPGDQLKEAALAKEFGVSRTPVRDAISRISHLGLIETRNGVGTVVIELSRERIHHLYEMRLELAAMIGQLSPIMITPAHIQDARNVHVQAVSLAENFNSREFVVLNQRLQMLISSLIGNSVLREFWDQSYFQAASVWHRMAKSIGPAVFKLLVKETKELLEALENNDIAAVGYIQRIYIGYGFRQIQAHLLSSPPDTNLVKP